MNWSLNFFYFFSCLTIISAILVIISINPIHSVLFLILVFINITTLLILLEVEFLAITLIIVYVGAIAVLFLFIVMMLNIKIVISNLTILRYLPIGGIIALIFLFEIVLMYNKLSINIINFLNIFSFSWDFSSFSNIQILGNLIYIYYYDLFLISSIILLIAMISAIILTMHLNYNIKKQQVFLQLYNK